MYKHCAALLTMIRRYDSLIFFVNFLAETDYLLRRSLLSTNYIGTA